MFMAGCHGYQEKVHTLALSVVSSSSLLPSTLSTKQIYFEGFDIYLQRGTQLEVLAGGRT
jgi:hypothetical protein